MASTPEDTIYRILNNKVKKGQYANTKGHKLTKKQIDTLQNYVEYLQNKPSSRGGRIKPNSIRNSLNTLFYFGHFIKKPYEDVKQKDVIDYIKTLDKKSDYTRSRWKIDIRSFYKWMHGITKPHEFPEVVDHPLLVPERPKNKLKPRDIVTKDEVMAMVNACFDNRSKAVIMTIAEGGLRASEMVSINVGSVEFDDVGCKIWVEKSKSKERFVRLIEASPFIQTWLNEHPNKDKPEAPLFCGVQWYLGKRLKNTGINLIIKRASERAGITKRVHTHLLRHYSVTNDGKLGLSSSMNAKRHGITTNTLERVYLHLSDSDVDEAYVRAKGKLSEEQKLADAKERNKLSPKECLFCKHKNPFNLNYCERCNRPLDRAEIERKAESTDKLVSLMRQLMDSAMSNPDKSFTEIVKGLQVENFK